MAASLPKFLFASMGAADETERAHLRRVVCACAFASTCLLLAPGELRSAGLLLFVTFLLWVRHRALLAREAEAMSAAPVDELRAADADPTLDDHLGT